VGVGGDPVKRLSKQELGPLTKVASGGQGVLYEAPDVVSDYGLLVYKEYKPQVVQSLNVDVLESMSTYLDSLSFSHGMRLVKRAAWPIEVVDDGRGVASGFLMPKIPTDFFIGIKQSDGMKPKPAEFQHLLNAEKVLAISQIPLTDRLRYQLLIAAAEALDILHCDDICVGDLSPKNLLFALSPHPAVFFVDCDSMALRGRSVAQQRETPGWEVVRAYPGETLATKASDNYKFGLLALRLLVGDQETRNPDRLPPGVPARIRSLIREALTAVKAGRPEPQQWIGPLTEAAASASNNPPRGQIPPQAPQSGTAASTQQSGSGAVNPYLHVGGYQGQALAGGYQGQGSAGQGYTVGPLPRRKWPFVAAAAVAAIIGVGYIAQKVSHSVGSPLSGLATAFNSSGDEGQIKQVVQAWTDAFNNRDLAGMQSAMCSGSAADLPSNVFQLRDRYGPFTNSVSNVKVSGDRATATVTSTWSNSNGTGGERFDDSFAVESGAWKICHITNF
jgi:hypothetical protein